jgi:hypothetical protein
MVEQTSCEICGSRLNQKDTDWAVPGRDCPRCGQFRYEAAGGNLPAGRWFDDSRKEHMILLSGWVREQNAANVIPTITRDVMHRVLTSSKPKMMWRALQALRLVVEKVGFVASDLGYDVMYLDAKILGSTYSLDSKEMAILSRILTNEGYIEKPDSGVGFRLAAKGILAVEEMAATGAGSAQGFVAMWFNPAFDAVWTNGFDSAIRKAGYRPFRIDKKDYVGGITDEIMAEIRRSRFVVADYTEQVNGVYFEAGFALGLGLLVIPTCREDQIGKLHFDIRHLNTLPWTTPNDLAENLSKRILAVVGAGPYVSR